MAKKIKRLTTNPAVTQNSKYLSLCVIFRDNITTISALLDSVKGHFDEYIFVDTGSTDGTREVIDAFLKTSAGKLADFPWVDDFSAARQFSFELATGRWRMFLDTDDVLVEGQNIRPLLRRQEEGNKPEAGFFVHYAYALDEELHTMRLVRWDATKWSWVDKIHERLEASPALDRTRYGQIHPKAFRVVHRHKSNDEKKEAILRNRRIAEQEYASASDKRYKARLARTLAMDCKAQGKLEEAIPYLEELVDEYLHYPEGRTGCADLAHIYVEKARKVREEKGDLDVEDEYTQYMDMALVWAKRAGPSYEAVVLHARGEYEKCIKAAQRGQGCGQQGTHEGALVEKAGAYLASADSLLRLGVPDAPDRAESSMNHIEPFWRTHPMLLGVATRIRFEIDRITIVVPGTPQPFDENGGGGMLGGSEEAVMYLSRALAQLGRNVRIYAPLPFHRLPGKDKYGVDWQPMSHFNADHEHGTLVVWRALGLVDQLAKARAKRNVDFPGIGRSFLWLHDIGLGAPNEVVENITNLLDGSIVLSEFHKSLTEQQGLVKATALSNGIVREDFEPHVGKWEKDPNSVVYTSCPSRGLMALLDMWPEVKAAAPNAKLDIYYDWTMFRENQPENFEKITDKMKSVSGLDVVHHGGVPHAVLNEKLRRANIWAYSHFQNPMVETFCISAVKASASGCACLTVPNGALPEVAPMSRFETSVVAYKNALIEMLLKGGPSLEERVAVAEDALERFSWDAVARRFSEVWTIREPSTAGGEMGPVLRV